jgi:PAS domain S-box-containing protein
MSPGEHRAASDGSGRPIATPFPEGLRAINIFEIIADAVAVLDRDWRFQYANRRTETLSGIPLQQLLGNVLWTLLPDLRGTPSEEGLRSTMEGRLPSRFEQRYGPHNLWLEVDAYPIPEGLVLFARNISDRKHAEERNLTLNRDLGRRVKEFETLLDCLPIGIGVAGDPECNDIRINQALASLLGTKTGINVSKTGPHAHELPFRITREGRELAGKELPIRIAARDGSEVRDFELDIERFDGTVVKELCFGQPLFDEEQKVRGSIGVFVDITESRRTEQALRESEARYRFLAEAMPQIVWIASTANQILYINSHWSSYTGLTLEQTQAGGWADTIHPDDVPHAVGQAEIGLEKGQYDAEYRLRRGVDGSYRWHMGRARIVTMSDGSVRWLGTAIDIHDRKQAEEERAEALNREHALRRQAEESLAVQRRIEQQLLLLVEASSTLMASPDSAHILNTILNLAGRFVGADAYAVWRKEADGTVWNIVAAEGLSDQYSRTLREQVGGVNMLPPNPLPIEDVEQLPLVRHRAHLYRQEGIRSMLVVPLRIHGNLEGTISFYYREPHRFNELETRVAGGLANLASAALGTAELYERQKSLRLIAESAERRANFLAEAGRVLSSSLDYETTLSSVADLAVAAIADWATVDIVFESGGGGPGELRRVALKHIDPEKIALAHEYTRRYPPDDSDAVRQALRTGKSVLIKDIPDRMAALAYPDSERQRFLLGLGLTSVIIAPLVANGHGFGVLTFITAESGRRFTESDLMLAEELAARAATAVANARLYKEQEIAREALQRFNAELKRANEDLNQFAYSASHDLREPLRMISIYSQILERNYRSRLDAPAQTFLDYMITGAKRMDMLIRDILEYTQAASISEDAIAAIPAAAAMEKAVANLELTIRQSGAEISSGPLPMLMVQETHLIQLFQNLLGNAIKYRSEETPGIRVTSERQNGRWKISVQDNGIGIAPEHAPQIFGIFTRLHSADKYSGTGIGLAICLKIVERYGGGITVDSEEGRGSTFSFTLPGPE